MPPRLFTDTPLSLSLQPVVLDESAARHAQVLRLQPGDPIILFDGRGGQWTATIRQMGRRDVTAELDAFDPAERELPLQVTIAAGMPANDRFDWLVEKATELGAAAIQPLMCERSVLRVAGERAQRKRQHWQGVAVAASEQCGRTRVPHIHEALPMTAWLAGLALDPAGPGSRWLLSPQARQSWAHAAPSGGASAVLLSGPEGGLTADEEARACAAGFTAVNLGPRTLRAETAPLVALAQITG